MIMTIKYTHPELDNDSPISDNLTGKATKKAVNKKCSEKIPRFNRHNCGCFTICRIWPLAATASRWLYRCSGVGVQYIMITAATTAIKALLQNKPDNPASSAIKGPVNMAMVNAAPMLIPMAAITLLRCSSRDRSAARAITALAMAPQPWNSRPTIIHRMWSDRAAMTLPIANKINPARITGFRP